jgi:hypothetical protein
MLKLICIFLFAFTSHAIHLGVTEINLNSSNVLEISHKIFYDDLQSAIEKQYKINLHLNTAKENPKTTEYIQRYLTDRFIIYCNGERQSIKYVGHEYEEDAIWIYCETPKVANQAAFSFTNRILFELHDDQSNFLHFTTPTNRKSLRFTFENQTQKLE